MIKCPQCGYEVADDAKYCSSCGYKIKISQKKRILLVEPVATSNFFLTKTLKKNGFEVKSLRSPNFVFDELSNYNYFAFIIDMDLSERSNLGFLKTLHKLYPKQNIIIITRLATKEDIKLLKSMNFSAILIKPVKAETILSYIEKFEHKQPKDNFKYPIHDVSEIEKVISEAIKENDITYILEFIIKDFSKQTIKTPHVVSMIDKVFTSTKRSDRFILIENVGILIIPTQEMDDKGANILKKRVRKFIDKEILISSGFFKYPRGELSLSGLCSLIINGEFEQETETKSESKSEPKIKADTEIIIENKAEAVDMDDIPTDELFRDKHLVFSALNHMDNEDVALLYFDESIKQVIAPFITITQAELIKKHKGKKQDFDLVKQRFTDRLFEIYRYNKGLINDGITKKLHSDISLMTLPEIQNNIIMLINEEASFKRIVSELQKDAAISAKVLKLVNSAFFGFSRRIKNLERAAAILGTEEILGLSLSIAYINSFSANVAFVKKLWKENIAIMSIIKFIENEYKVSTSSITPSILSSIGKIFFAEYFPEQYIKTVREAQKGGKIYDSVELKYFSIPHTQVGAMIIDAWSLPEKIKISAMYHTYPSAFSKLNTSLHLIHAAKYVAGSMGYSTTPQPIDNMSYYTYTMLLKKHGIDVKKVYEDKKKELKDYIEEMMFLLV